jgi:hypothetical protein
MSWAPSIIGFVSLLRLSFVIFSANLTATAHCTSADRERLQIGAGDRFKFFFHPDGVLILPRIPTRRLKGSVPRLPQQVSAEEVDKAIEASTTKRFRPI